MTDFYISDEDKVGLTTFHRDSMDESMDEYFARLDQVVKRNKECGIRWDSFYRHTDYSPYVKMWKELYKVKAQDD